MDDPFDVELTDDERHAGDLIDADMALLRALIKRRNDLGLTQEDVAKAIGRDPSAVSRFERLDSDPHMSTIRRYARAVRASIKHDVCDWDPGTEVDTVAPERSGREVVPDGQTATFEAIVGAAFGSNRPYEATAAGHTKNLLVTRHLTVRGEATWQKVQTRVLAIDHDHDHDALGEASLVEFALPSVFRGLEWPAKHE